METPPLAHWTHEVVVDPMFINAGGTLDIGERAEVSFNGNQPFAVGAGLPDCIASFAQTSGTTLVSHGSKLTFFATALFRSGTLTTRTSTAPPQAGTVLVDPVTIVGDVISFANINILSDKSGVFGNLKFEGNLDWNAGELSVKLDGRAPGNVESQLATLLKVPKQLTVNSGTVAAPRAKLKFVLDGVAPGTPAARGRKWIEVVTAGTKIQLQNNGTVEPVTNATTYHIEEKTIARGNSTVVNRWDIPKD